MPSSLETMIRPELRPFVAALGPVLLLGSYFFVGLLLYWARRLRHGRFEDEEIVARGSTALIGMAPRHYFAWVMSPVWKALVRLDVPANAITTLSVLIAMASGTALAAGYFALGGWLYIFAGACDFVDGRLARASGRSSPAGAAFDSVLDRYAESAVFIGLAWYYRDSWVLLAVLLALCGSHLVPYVRARGEGLGVEVKVGMMQRPERLVIIGVTTAFSPIVEALFAPGVAHPVHRLAVLGVLFLAMTTPITALFRLFHVMSALDPAQKNLMHKPAGVGGVGRNLISALVATASDFALVYVLVREIALAPWIATLLGCALGGFVNFVINRIWAFESRAPALGQAARYTFVSASSALINAGGVSALLLLPGFDALWAWWVVRGLTFLTWNYPLHRDYVYVKPNAESLDHRSASAAGLLALLLFAAAPNAEASTVLRPDVLSDENFAETFSFFVDADDGSYVQAQLGISNVGPGDKKGGCRVLVVRPGLPAHTASSIVDEDKWRHDAKLDQLIVGDCKVSLGPALTVVTRHGDDEIIIELAADANRAKSRAMSVKTKGGFFESEILIPAAPAKLRLRSGGKVEDLKGFGYADHSRSKTMPRDLAKGWVRFRKVTGSEPLLLLARLPPESEVEGWMRPRASDASLERPIRRLQVQESEDDKARTRFRVMLDVDGAAWRITSLEPLYRFAPIEEQGLLGRVVSSVVGNPVTFVFRAVLEKKGSSERHEGILEVSFSDDKRRN